MVNQDLWDQKKKAYMEGVNKHLKHKRIALKHITGSRTTRHHTSEETFDTPANVTFSSSTTTTTTTTASSSLVLEGEDSLMLDAPTNNDLAHENEQNHVADKQLVPSSVIPPSLPPRLDIPDGLRCKCGQYKFNRSCSGKLCQKCCSKSLEHCTVTNHAKCKPPGYNGGRKKTPSNGQPLPPVLPGVIEHLADAMKAGRDIYIAYTNRDPNEKRARRIKPIGWVQYGECFKAICFIDNIEKNYNTHKVARIESQSWDVVMPMPGEDCAHFI
jgi:hypothetical protein